MCAIIGWAGKIPKGLLTRMLIGAETRGKDSTGLAFRAVEDGKTCNLCYRHIVPARTFVDIHKDFVGDARRSFRGIAHTRNASPGMPIDNSNAHPYVYPWENMGKYYFAHNGRIQNWKVIKAEQIEIYSRELNELISEFVALTASGEKPMTAEEVKVVLTALAKAEREPVSKEQDALKALAEDKFNAAQGIAARLRYVENATTDSMILGPCIENRDFSEVDGCMALVWMKADNVYTFRSAKEAVAATVVWKYKKPASGEPADDQLVTIVASTKEIIEKSFDKIADAVDSDIAFINYDEGRIYRLMPNTMVDEGRVPVHQAIEDEFSSSVVETETAEQIKIEDAGTK